MDPGTGQGAALSIAMATGTDTDNVCKELVEAALLEQFAGFLKSSFIYPSNNERVQRLRDSFLETFGRIAKEAKSDPLIVVDGDAFLVVGKRLASKTPLNRWLRDVFIKTAICGVRFAREVDHEPLHNFAEQLRRNFSCPGSSFEMLWQDAFPGVWPVELRFAGTFTEADQGDEAEVGKGERLDRKDQVMGMLLQDEALMRKLAEMQDTLALHLPDGSKLAQINILDPISKALPVEAMLDSKTACDLVDQILDVCGSRVLSLIADDKRSAQDALDVAVAEVGRRFFKAHVKDLEAKETEKLPEGRPEDEGIVDDLDAMLAELEALPSGEGIRLDLSLAQYDREVFGVYLHQLVQPMSDDVGERISEKLFEFTRGKDGLGDLCAPYIDVCLSERGSLRENRAYWRVVDFVQRAGLRSELGDRDFLAPDIVAFTFPRQFGAFLDSLDSSCDEDIQQIAHVCRHTGPDRIALAGEYLVQKEGLIEDSRVHKLLATESDSVLPLIKIVVESGPDWVRELVSKFLRELDPPVKESAALRGVRPLTDLSAKYLGALCESHPDSEQRKWLQDESSRMLRVYLRRTADHDESNQRRIIAINLLCLLPSFENLNALESIVKEGGFLLLSKDRRELRKAAREAYDDMLSQVSGGRR